MGSTAPTAGQGQSKDVVDEMRGGLRHSSSSTRRTPAAPAAGKRNQPLVPARTAADTYKPAGCKNAAGQVVPKFPFNETRDRTVALLLSGEEGFQLLGNHLIQQFSFRIARPVP